MPRPQVPDTTEFIRLIRAPDDTQSLYNSIVAGRFYLSSVVLSELYAGTRSSAEAGLVDRIAAAAERIHRLLAPTNSEWASAGRLISRRIRLDGFLQPRDHLADVLIVLTAARLQGEVVSANLRHMRPWVRLAQRAGLDVVLVE
jgi:predicted nucleic acid-binding protein